VKKDLGDHEVGYAMGKATEHEEGGSGLCAFQWQGTGGPPGEKTEVGSEISERVEAVGNL